MFVPFDLKLIASIIALIISTIPKTPKLSETSFFRLSKFTQFLMGFLNNYGSLTAIIAVFLLLINTLSQDIICITVKQTYYEVTYRTAFGIIFMIIFIIFLSAFSLFIEIKTPAIRRRIIMRNIKKYLDQNI